MNDNNLLAVEFPLKGEWVAPHTPGDKIPSHGTDSLGQRYAYDFLRTDINSKNTFKFFKSSVTRYWTLGISIHDCYCYKEPIYSPVNGKVILVKDGVNEPAYLHPILDMFKIIIRTISATVQGLFLPVNKIQLHKFIGNHVIIQFEEYYALFAHISPGTIQVKKGQMVKIGDVIGGVGHSGNSTAPHLHFHIMDSPDLLKAKGVLCAFKKYYIFDDYGWEETKNGIPKSTQRIKV